MSWHRLKLYLARTPALPTEGAAIVSEAIRRAAEDYVAALAIGDAIVEATDGPIIAPFRLLIPAALAKKGLQLVQIEGGWRVQRSSWPALPPLRAECAECHASIFRCAHGLGAVIWEATP